MKIGTREIGNGNPTYIIAEAGTGHVGRYHKAKELATEAKIAGADAVKFQMFVPDEDLFCPLPGDENRRPRWDRTWLCFADWQRINWHCSQIGITFLASAFQPTAVQWLKDLNVAAYKVASRAAATYPYDAVPGPFIVSMGMAPDLPYRDWHDTTFLNCVSKYPTPLNDAQWPDGNWGIYGKRGLSDHSGTIWPGLDAMARGCPMLEVHFAIDKADAGNDSAVCLTVDQLKLLCEARDAFAEMRR